MRRCGVLMPVSSLPSRFGIGGFSKEAYDFVDFLAASGQSLWQILPLGPTGYGDSPYQSFSTFAGSPYYISLDALIEEGLLTEEECSSVDCGNDTGKVDYEKIYHTRFQLLRRAFERAEPEKDPEYRTFVSENEQWLKDYALYMAVKDSLGACRGSDGMRISDSGSRRPWPGTRGSLLTTSCFTAISSICSPNSGRR